MDHKGLKSDLTYALKKLTKEGKTLTLFADNLEVLDEKYVLNSQNVEVLEALALVKGYLPAPESLQKFTEQWTDPQGAPHVLKYAQHELSGPDVISAISVAAGISKADLYDFYDGLENVAGNDKSEFYKVGVYIREKFTPLGIRAETLPKTKYQEFSILEIVRKFIVHNRPAPGCKKTGVPTVVEVECEVFIPPFYKSGEFAARINKPEWLWEPTRVLQDGVLKDVVLPPTYHSHSIFATLEEAMSVAERQVRHSFDFEVRKGRISSYTEEEVKAKCTEIQEILLPQ